MKKLELNPEAKRKQLIKAYRDSVSNDHTLFDGTVRKPFSNTPDRIFFMSIYSYHDNEAVPFVYLTFNDENQVFFGGRGETHYEIYSNIHWYLYNKGYKMSDITGDPNHDKVYDNMAFQYKGEYIRNEAGNPKIVINGRYYLINIPELNNKKCVVFTFWELDRIPMDKINDIVYTISKRRRLFDREIYIANGTKPLIHYNEFTHGDEDELENNSQQHIAHMLPSKEKHEVTADFRNTRDRMWGQKLTRRDGSEMPMAQYNALRYVDEGTVNKSKHIIYMTEEQINHIKKELLNEITIYDKYGIEKKNGKTKLDFATYSKICTLDPTSIVVNNQRQAGKFCNWLLQRFDPERLSDTQYCRQVRNALEQYSDGIKKGILKRYGVNTDIGSFKTIDGLVSTMQKVMGSNTTNVSMSISNAMEKLNGQYEIIAESPNWYIIMPSTFEAERFFGSHTEWCTVANSDYFNGYTRRGPLYITFPKNGDNKLKMQFHFPTDSFGTYEDEVYRNPKVCIYNVLGDGDEFDEVCAMWKEASASFKKYTFVKNSEVPEMLKNIHTYNELRSTFDYTYTNNDEYITVGLNDKYNVVKHSVVNGKEEVFELISPKQWFYNLHGFFNNEKGRESFVVETETSRYNVLNTNGELLFKNDVVSLGTMSDGWAIVRLDITDSQHKWNFINDKGELLLSENVFNVRDFNLGYGQFAKKGLGWNLVTPDGKIVFENYYRSVFPAYGKHGLFIVELGTDTYDVLREDGTSLTPQQKYNDIRSNLEYNGFVVKIKGTNGGKGDYYFSKELKDSNSRDLYYLKADGTLCYMYDVYHEPKPIPQEELDRLGIKIKQPQIQYEHNNNYLRDRYQLVNVNENKKIIYLTENQVSEIQKRLEQARSETNTNPSEKQKEAGNYKLGRINIFGFDIAIENPIGSIRRGKNKQGKEWQIKMKNDYGYFTHTKAIDGDAIDVFIGKHLDENMPIYAIDQKIGGKFDETKVMLGFKTAEEAKSAYMSNYSKDWNGFWKITKVDMDTFRKWLYDGYKQRKPFFQYKEIKGNKLNESVDFYKKNKFKLSGENISDYAHVISETFDDIISEYDNGDVSKILTKENINEFANDNELKNVISSFDVHKELNPKIWVNGKLNSRVRLRLLDIADLFYDSLDVNWVKPKDIIITGSIANYNWSKYSDIDIHILLDFKDVDERTEFVKSYFDSKKKNWNDEHDELTIYGYPVELYVQDVNEKHTASGIYSLEKNKWIKEPEYDNLASVKLDKESLVNKTKVIADKIEDLENECKTEHDIEKLDILSNKVKKLFDKIKGMRKDALKNGSELSNGNIIFKILRRLGYIGRLVDLKTITFDKINSIK